MVGGEGFVGEFLALIEDRVDLVEHVGLEASNAPEWRPAAIGS